MLIIAASPDVNIQKFIELIHQSSCEFAVQSFDEWQHTNIIPQGFIYIQVAPEISFKRLINTNKHVNLQDIQKNFEDLHTYFIVKTLMPHDFQAIPTLTLNGFVDFEADFSQFYNHLFYIKKFFNEIKEKENKKKGIFVPKKHTGCKC
jgi:hypothetical protein